MTTENQPTFEIGIASHTGRKRSGSPNQDYVKVVDDANAPFLIVADGMGGHRGGAVASAVAVEAMLTAYHSSPAGSGAATILNESVKAAHQALILRASQDAELNDMGTTVVAAILESDRIYIINVGDSRAYIFRGQQVLQVSRDQSWVAEQIRAGLLTPEQARTHPKRSHLMMSLSAKRRDVFPYIGETVLQPNDVVLLCTDGLWGAVPESLIAAVSTELPPQKAADRLIDLANASTGPDNISVIVARQVGSGLSIPAADLDETNPGLIKNRAG